MMKNYVSSKMWKRMEGGRRKEGCEDLRMAEEDMAGFWWVLNWSGQNFRSRIVNFFFSFLAYFFWPPHCAHQNCEPRSYLIIFAFPVINHVEKNIFYTQGIGTLGGSSS